MRDNVMGTYKAREKKEKKREKKKRNALL